MKVQTICLLLLKAHAALSIGTVAETYRVTQSYPEGIAYDAANQRILLSSLVSNSIMSFDPANGMAAVTTYTPDSTNPSGMGLKVVGSQVYATIDNFANQDNGGLAVYELPVTADAEANATVVSSVSLPCTDGDTKCGLANDVVADESGVSYVTDSALGRVFKVENGEMELISDDERLMWDDPSFPFAANGLVHIPDLNILLVANSQQATLFKIDLSTNELTEVVINGDVNGGADGMLLSSDNVLYAVTGGTHITAFSSQDEWVSVDVVGSVDVSSEDETAATITFGETEEEIYLTHVRFGDLFGAGANEDPSLISKVVLGESSTEKPSTTIIISTTPAPENEETVTETTTAAVTTDAAATDATATDATATDASTPGADLAATGLTPTDGNCAMAVRMQEEGEELVAVPDWHQQGNIVVNVAPTDCEIAVSDTWTIAGWTMNIIQLGPNQVYTVPELADDMRQAVKILRGSLLDVNFNGILKSDGHWHTYTVTTPNRAIPLWIDNAVIDFTAGDDGAVITYWTVSEEHLVTPATDMNAAPVTDMAGPLIENLKWYNCGTDYGWGDFEGYEFWNFPGMLVQENDGSRLMYMQWWTFREDFDADAYHNKHPIFGEIHMTMYQGTGVAGMQTTLASTSNLNFIPNPDPVPDDRLASYAQNDQSEVQIAMPMPPGFAHGPLWYVDPSTGEPATDCDGNMVYPFHRQLFNNQGSLSSPLRYHLWVAFEHPPEDVTVPLEMITEWPNANLQSTMPAVDCNAVTDGGEETGGGTADSGESDDVTEESDDVTEVSDDVTEESESAAEETPSGAAFHFSSFAWAVAFAFMVYN
jgi:sugar lactone lactonase YvrE